MSPAYIAVNLALHAHSSLQARIDATLSGSINTLGNTSGGWWSTHLGTARATLGSKGDKTIYENYALQGMQATLREGTVIEIWVELTLTASRMGTGASSARVGMFGFPYVTPYPISDVFTMTRIGDVPLPKPEAKCDELTCRGKCCSNPKAQCHRECVGAKCKCLPD